METTNKKQNKMAKNNLDKKADAKVIAPKVTPEITNVELIEDQKDALDQPSSVKSEDQLAAEAEEKRIADEIAAEQAEVMRIAALNPLQKEVEKLKTANLDKLAMDQLEAHREVAKQFKAVADAQIAEQQIFLEKIEDEDPDSIMVETTKNAIFATKNAISIVDKCDLDGSGNTSPIPMEFATKMIADFEKLKDGKAKDARKARHEAFIKYIEISNTLESAKLLNPKMVELKNIGLKIGTIPMWVEAFQLLITAGKNPMFVLDMALALGTVKPGKATPKGEGETGIKKTASAKTWIFTANGVETVSESKHSDTIVKILIANEVPKFEGTKMIWDGISELNLVPNTDGINGANTNTADPATKCRLIKEYSKFEIKAKS